MTWMGLELRSKETLIHSSTGVVNVSAMHSPARRLEDVEVAPENFAVDIAQLGASDNSKIEYPWAQLQWMVGMILIYSVFILFAALVPKCSAGFWSLHFITIIPLTAFGVVGKLS